MWTGNGSAGPISVRERLQCGPDRRILDAIDRSYMPTGWAGFIWGCSVCLAFMLAVSAHSRAPIYA